METPLEWYDAGITPIPIKPMTKQASIKWKRWQTRRPPRELVETWFSNGNRNVGLLVGPVSGNLVVLDFDTIPGYFYWKLVHKYRLANSYTVKTNRGFHVYLFVDEPVENPGRFVGVDIKCSGYVVAPPSVHPSGNVYEVYQDNEILRTSCMDMAVVGLTRMPNEPKMCGGVTVNIAGDATVNQTTINTRPFGSIDELTGLRLPHNVVRQIKSACTILDIANWYTEMRPSSDDGNWYVGRCPHPQHKDVHPSFALSLRNGRANCKTPTCALHSRNGLDVIDLVGALEGLGPRQAMALLAIRLGLVGDNSDNGACHK